MLIKYISDTPAILVPALLLLIIILPAIIAHKIIFKVSNPKSKFFCTIIVIIYIGGYLALDNAYKYGFKSSNSKESATQCPAYLPSPTCPIISNSERPIESWEKDLIHGDYSLKIQKNLGAKLYRNDTIVWDQYLPFDYKQVNDYLYDSVTNSLFVSERAGPDIESGNYEEIYLLTKSGPLFKKAVLDLDVPGIYAGSKFLDFFPNTNHLLLHTWGGDGCGGSGKIWVAGLC